MKSFFNSTWTQLPDEIFKKPYLDPLRTAVITVDMHRGHLDPSPDCPAPSERGRALIEPVNAFTASCRARDIPVIHVRSVLRKDGSDDINGNISAWRLLRTLRDGDPVDTAQHAIEGSKWIEFCVNVEETDYIVNTKKRLSAFYPSDLELLLRNLHKDILVVTGILTDCCILSTVIEGANHDFRMIVPKDLTRGYAEYEPHALNIISRYFGLVVDSTELIQTWDMG